MERAMIRKSFAAAVAVTVAVGISFSPIIWAEGAVANAAEIKVLSADVFTGVLDELASAFERTSGHRVTIVYGTAGATRSRIQAGEIGDVTILPRPMSLLATEASGVKAPGVVPRV